MRRIMLILLALPSLVIGQDSLNVTRVGAIVVQGTPQDIEISGSFAYIAAGIAGLRVFDVSDVSNPSEVGFLDTPWFAESVNIQGNIVYVGDGASGLRVIDVTNPHAPVEIAEYDSDVDYRHVAVAGDYALAVCNHEGIRVVIVSDPSDPVEVGTVTPFSGFALDVVAQGTYAFVANMDYGLQIVDFANPVAPTIVGARGWVQGAALSIDVAENRAYLTTGNPGKLYMIDVSNATNPALLGDFDIPEPDTCYNVDAWGMTAFLAAGSSGLRIVDCSSPVNPIEVGFYETSLPAVAIHAVGNLVYMVDGVFLRIYDVSAALSAPETRNPIATQFSLHPIFPNPFNNTANISFELPREVTGRLVVYDVLGRIANTLYDGRLSAGSHQMQFDGASLSSGVYILGLETSGFAAIQKAVLVK